MLTCKNLWLTIAMICLELVVLSLLKKEIINLFRKSISSKVSLISVDMISLRNTIMN